MACGRCDMEAKYHDKQGACPDNQDEPKCRTHGANFMLDVTGMTQCVPCLQEEIADLKEVIGRISYYSANGHE